MLKKNLFRSSIIASLLLTSCAHLAKKPAPVSVPIVRVGILEDVEAIKFRPQGRLRIFEKEGGQYRSDERGEWTIFLLESKKAGQEYRVVLLDAEDRATAERLKASLAISSATEIQPKGDALAVRGKIIAGRKRFRLQLKEAFASRQQAEEAVDSLGLKEYQIIANDLASLGGTIRIKSPSGGSLDFDNIIRLTGSPIQINGVAVGAGFHFARTENRTYAGEIEVRISKSGKLLAINVLPLENYIEGVLPGEMTSSFPLEALKAQAIVARTFFLYQFGRSHRDDPFDVCDDVHSQSFVGITRQDAKIRKAVRETRGLVVTYKGELAMTPYSAVCGGHTENAENVWTGDGKPYLQGFYDIHPKRQDLTSFDLQDEGNFEKWVKSRPNVFCNAELNGNPKFARYSNKYFRWTVNATRTELEKQIKKQTGQDIGTLLDLVVLQRGVSGRIINLKVVGSKGSMVVGKELKIRQLLSPSTLYSAAFSIEKLPGGNGIPTDFVFRGAGWGHGVGMCQVGAGIMADKGYGVKDILEHYYQGVSITRYY